MQVSPTEIAEQERWTQDTFGHKQRFEERTQRSFTRQPQRTYQFKLSRPRLEDLRDRSSAAGCMNPNVWSELVWCNFEVNHRL